MPNPFRRTKNPHLLEVAARPWVRRMAPPGEPPSLDSVPDDALRRIHDAGFHGVWLMGAWTTGPEGRQLALAHPELHAAYDRVLPGWTDADVGGSPYSIQAYEPAPDLGGGDPLPRFRSRLHEHGLGLMLDFVPNHLARDHPWTATHPERLVTGTVDDLRREAASWFERRGKDGSRRVFAHGRDPNFPGWTDTVQVDYRRPETREAMTRLLLDLGGRCDGLRCDVAMLLLEDVFQRTWGTLPGQESGDFWTEAIAALRAGGDDVLLLAEAYWGTAPRLVEAGFDFVYDKGLYDDLLSADAAAVRGRLQHGAGIRRGAHFLENHDEERAVEAFGEERLAGACAITYCLPGLRFFQDGQDEGRRLHVPVQLSRSPEEPASPECRDLHERLWRLLAEPVFQEGSWQPLPGAPCPDGGVRSPLVAGFWTLGPARRLVVANLSGAPQRAALSVPVAGNGPSPLAFRDLLGEDRFERSRKELRQEGLVMELGPWAARVLAFEDVPS